MNDTTSANRSEIDTTGSCCFNQSQSSHHLAPAQTEPTSSSCQSTDAAITWSPNNATDDHVSVRPIVGGSCLAILTLVMFVGNLMAVVTIFGSVRLRRRPKYLLLGNLAIADLLWSVLLMPVATAWEIMEVWRFGEILCDVYNIVDISVSTISTYSLLLISVNQYLNISRPFKYISIVTTRRTVLTIATVWLFWLVYGVVSVFARLYVDPSFPANELTDPCLFVMNKPFAVTSAVMTFLLPFVLLTSFSVRIIIITNQHVKRFSAISNNNEPNGFLGISSRKSSMDTVDQVSGDSNHQVIRSSRRRVSWRGVALLLGVVVTFILMIAPYYLSTLVNALCDCVPAEVLDNYLVYLYYMNPLVNPYIYIAADRKYRDAMRDKLACVYKLCRKRALTLTPESATSDIYPHNVHASKATHAFTISHSSKLNQCPESAHHNYL